MRPFPLHIHTAQRDFYNDDCLSLIVPTSTGQYGIQAAHYNMIAAIVPGNIEVVLPNGDKAYAYISSGILKVQAGEVLILAGEVLTLEELQDKEVRRRQDDLKEQELQKRQTKDFLEAEAAMRRTIYKLKNKRNQSNIQ